MLVDHLLSFFFFHDTASPEIYTLSLHDALPILAAGGLGGRDPGRPVRDRVPARDRGRRRRGRRGAALHRSGDRRRAGTDRKSTRLNSSHLGISYAVFCLKKKKKTQLHTIIPQTT